MQEFRDLINDFEAYLTDLQLQCNRVDNLAFSVLDKIVAVQKLESSVFPTLNDFWNRVWVSICDLHPGSEAYGEYRSVVTAHLLPFFKVGVLNSRIWDKPLGYNGDYLTIYQCCRDYHGDTVYEILINQYTRSREGIRAHMARFPYLKRRFRELARKPNAKILSVGSGPAAEVLQFSSEEPEIFSGMNFTLLDMEPKALEFVKGRIPWATRINYIEYPVAKFLLDIRRQRFKTDSFDFVYCFGLYDYLDDKTATALTIALFNSLEDHGNLTITNVSRETTDRAYWDFFGGWRMYLRDEVSMLSLATDISTAKRKEIVESPHPFNIYLNIQK